MILRGPRVLLRPANAEDLDRLVEIRREPEVETRWGQADPDEIREAFVGADDAFVIEVRGVVVGGIQYSEETDPMYLHAGIDIFITTTSHRQGLGPEAVRELARHLFDQRGHHRVTIDPAADNAAAIKAYEKVGFRRVGIMRDYERGLDGSWHDGLLMDLLKDELVPDD